MFGRADCSRAEHEHVANSSVNFSSGVKKLDNRMGSLSYSSMPGKNKGRETGLPFLTTIAQEGGSIRCAVDSVGQAGTILLQCFHPDKERGLALENFIQVGRNGA